MHNPDHETKITSYKTNKQNNMGQLGLTCQTCDLIHET